MGLLRFLALTLFSSFHFTQFIFTVTDCFPHVQLAEAKCHKDESAALLEFKASFMITKSASLNHFSYPKIESWMKNTDCCSWHGVECDEHTGNVIGLDLASSQLQGSLNPNSSLFRLVKLRSLNLSDNNLGYSQIPSKLGDLSSLKYLNLSQSKFSGEIPAEISKLSKLRSLDLSFNNMQFFPFNRLRFKRDDLRSIIQNLTKLEILMLAHVKISSPVLDIFTNLTSLKSLNLFDCELFDEFPIRIFHLRNLRNLDLRFNQNLVGYLDEFHSSSRLKNLRLDYTRFHGALPASIGNLKSLKRLSLYNCKFSGSIPSSVSNLTQLIDLNLCYNNFMGHIPSSLSNLSQLYELCIGGNEINGVTVSWIGKLTRLQTLTLESINIEGEIPFSFANLSEISSLSLVNCYLSGEIPLWIMNLTKLVLLNLADNKLHGHIPPTLFELKNLHLLDLCSNLLSRAIPSSLGNLSQLVVLELSHNRLSGSIPQHLAELTLLQVFDVSNNYLTGPIPHTKQFATFPSSSYEGNQGLCGCPLLKKCESSLAPPSRGDEDQEPRSLFDFGWKVVLVGYVCGLVVGVAIGSTLSLERHGWLRRIYRFLNQHIDDFSFSNCLYLLSQLSCMFFYFYV